jgi:hypothetical protein
MAAGGRIIGVVDRVAAAEPAPASGGFDRSGGGGCGEGAVSSRAGGGRSRGDLNAGGFGGQAPPSASRGEDDDDGWGRVEYSRWGARARVRVRVGAGWGSAWLSRSRRAATSRGT